jgi:hypothetical protein
MQQVGLGRCKMARGLLLRLSQACKQTGVQLLEALLQPCKQISCLA